MQDAAVDLIIGHKGQDGSILREQLLNGGRTIYGLGKDGLENETGSIDADISLSNGDSLRRCIEQLRPQHVYYLAAVHHSAQSLPESNSLMHDSIATNTLALADILEAIRLEAPSAHLFYAASPQVFGDPPTSPQTEDTPFAPRSPYAVSKAAGVELCRYYRRVHGIFASCGYLYNHESVRRPQNFLSRKTAIAAAAIADGCDQKLVLGHLDAIVDWGYAPEYCQAMRLILSLPDASDFIVASGKASTVQDFVEAAFSHVGLDWRDHVRVDPTLIRRPQPTLPYVGDPRRLKEAAGWRAQTTVAQIAAVMVDAERRA